MAISHARICGACERECPSWADRCPACGSSSLVRRIVVDPVSPVAAHVAAKSPRRDPSWSRRTAGQPPPRHGTPTHSTA